MQPLKSILLRDFRLLFRKKMSIASPFLLLIAIIAFIPLAMNIDSREIDKVMLGCLLLYSIFVTNWVLGDFIQGDMEDGTVQFYQSTHNSNALFFIAKYAFAWLITGMPIVAIAAAVGQGGLVVIGFTLATMINTMISLIVLLCTSAIKKSQMLVSFVSLPFYLPVLVFTSSIFSGVDGWHNIMLMAAMLLFIAPVGILLGTYTLKIKFE